MPDTFWKQMIPLRRLFISLQRTSRPVPAIGRLGLKIAELITGTSDLRGSHNPFFELPNELLLIIAKFLEKEFQLTLSLSCRRFRVLLNSSLDLSLRNVRTKLRFLHCVERDYPEYLICRSCGFMFKWQNRRLMDYRCPRVIHHLLTDWLTSFARCMQGDRNIWVTREVIDLIFRAQERGERYGLPLSSLNTSGSDHNSVTRTNEVLLVDGQLMLASLWEVFLDFREDFVHKGRFFSSALCLHREVNVWREKIWQTVEQTVASMTGLEGHAVSKCPFCETDYHLRVQNSTSCRMIIGLIVWRSYGRRNENELSNEQMFHLDPSSRIDADAVSRRDLRPVFESYRSGTDR